MADPNFAWIYLIIFMAIPLARIIPRLLAKRGIGSSLSSKIQDIQSQSNDSFLPKREPSPQTEPTLHTESTPPQNKNQLVLGALNRGFKSFEGIQKNTGFDSTELDSILEDLENHGMLKVVQKQGLVGTRTELHITDKGFKEYYS